MFKRSRKVSAVLAAALLPLLVTIAPSTIARAEDATGAVKIVLVGVDEKQHAVAVSTLSLELLVFKSDIAIATLWPKPTAHPNAPRASFEFESVPADPSYSYVAAYALSGGNDYYLDLGKTITFQAADPKGGEPSPDTYQEGLSTSWDGLIAGQQTQKTLTVATLSKGSGQVSGVLYDSSNQALAGESLLHFETVRVNNRDYQREGTLETNNAGEYSITGIRVGAKVTLSPAGMDPANWVTQNFTLTAAAAKRTLNLFTRKVAGAPILQKAPEVVGVAKVAKQLVASAGTWSANPSVRATFSWYRCAAAIKTSVSRLRVGVDECSQIQGANKSTYQVSRSDVGKFLTVLVSVKNKVGNSTSVAKSTAKVTP